MSPLQLLSLLGYTNFDVSEWMVFSPSLVYRLAKLSVMSKTVSDTDWKDSEEPRRSMSLDAIEYSSSPVG